MSTQANRQILAECAIAIMTCGALQYFIAQPVSRAVAGTREQVEQARAAGAGTSTVIDAQGLAASASRIIAAVDQIDQRAERFESPSAMLDEFTSAAARCGVRIEELRPLQTVELVPVGTPASGSGPTPMQPVEPTSSNPAAPGAGTPAAAGPATRDLRSTCHLTVSGSFSGVLRLAATLTDSPSFAEISSMHISPTGTGDSVVAQIQLNQYRFDTSPVRRAIASAGGTAPARPGEQP